MPFIPYAAVLLVGLIRFLPDLTDFWNYLLWLLCFVAMGVIFLPVTGLAFGRFKSGGYFFSKVLCLAVAGYLQWMLSSLHILPFRLWSCLLVMLLVAAANFLVNRKTGTWQRLVRDESLYRSAVGQEALFAGLLLFWTIIRSMRPEIEGLEKYMEFGFINSILRSDWLPAPDMWFAGMDINYYYLGHYFSAFLTRLTTIDAAVTYNLMMATLFALSFMLAYSVAEMLIEIYQSNCAKRKDSFVDRRAGAIAGVVAGLSVCLAGNLHAMIFAVLFPSWGTSENYWFPDATRYIGYNPEVAGDKTIHEFPLYSYVVADLHAHVINMLFVLTAIGLVIALAVGILRIFRRQEYGQSHMVVDALKSTGVAFALVILLVGLFSAINFWDYPIYIVFTGAMLLYANLRAFHYSTRSLLITLGQVAILGVGAYIATLPFHLSFESMGNDIKLVQYRSMLRQLFVLWGWQLFFAGVLTFLMVTRYRLQGLSAAVPKRKSKGGKANAKAIREAETVHPEADPDLYIPVSGEKIKPPLFRFMEKVNPADAIVFVMFICATGLVIIPEIIYVVDIYPDHPRANTMFKLGYQAFIMFGLGAGYTFVRLMLERKEFVPRRNLLVMIGSALIASALIFPFYAIDSWYGNPVTKELRGLDGTKYMLTSGAYFTTDITLAEDYELIQYIKHNIKGAPVIAEALGDSYTANGRIAANTGLQNILNWYYHEVLWRNSNYALVDERRDDINALYESGDPARVREVINKYGVEYIVVGQLERIKYPEMDEDVLQSMGEIIFRSGSLYMIRVAI